MRVLGILILTVFLGCAPKPTPMEFPKSQFEFGPQKSDTDLMSKSVFQKSSKDLSSQLQWDEVNDTGSLYRVADGLLQLSLKTKKKEIYELAKNWVGRATALPGFQVQVPFADSYYIDVAVKETKDNVLREISLAAPQIKSDTDRAVRTLNDLSKSYIWAGRSGSLEEAATGLIGFLEQYAQRVKSADFFPPLKEELYLRLHEYIRALKQDTENAIPKISQGKNLSEVLKLVVDLLKKYKIKIDEPTSVSIAQGLQISERIDECHDETTALAAIIEIWQVLTKEERKQYVKAVKPSLYMFLNVMGNTSLECLKTDDCPGVIRDLIKKHQVFPGLRKYGVQKACQDMNEKAVVVARDKILSIANQHLVQVGSILERLIKDEVEGTLNEMQKISSDYHGFLRRQVSEWSKVALKESQGKVVSVEAPQIRIAVKNGKVHLELASAPDALSTETLGASLSFYQRLLETRREFAEPQSSFELRVGIEQVLRLFSLSDFRESHYVEDYFRTGQEQRRIPVSGRGLQISAGRQADAIYGISRAMLDLRDWMPSIFDRTLGLISAQDLIPNLKHKSLEQPFFPKSDLFALSVSDAGNLLKNITRELSHVFLVDTDGKVIWANEFGFDEKSTAVMAGVVNIVSGVRSDVVNTEDVAKYLLALAEFLESTSGIEATRASQLTLIENTGTSPLKDIIDGRKRVQQLIVAFANFISYQLMDRDGLVHHRIGLKNFKAAGNEKKTTLDQALCIQALLKASQLTPVTLYKWSAVDIYYSMNKSLFRNDLHFYLSDNEAAVSEKRGVHVPTLIETLKALQAVAPELPQQSQKQLSWITNPWIEALTFMR